MSSHSGRRFSSRRFANANANERHGETEKAGGLARSHGDCDLRSDLPCLLTRGDAKGERASPDLRSDLRVLERQGCSPLLMVW
ncbi:MAG: hypothetical protein PUP91_16805 [Rhizonema sp. PD37]|nr:hypothetical protein [Rhizonema sp. PD37]